jgi:plasmid maintenance system antidote protein VapI
MDEAVDRLVASMEPLTPETTRRLVKLLGPPPQR